MNSNACSKTVLGAAPLHFFPILFFLCLGRIDAVAQDGSQPAPRGLGQTAQQSGRTIIAVPDRPTFSNTADTIQTGVFQLEYGIEAAKGHQNINGLLKFGISENLELRFANNPFERDAGSSALGDSGVGLKYRFFMESGALPTLSFLYNATLPTAGDGLESEGVGHAAAVLVSKDFGKHHLDFNEAVEWRSRSHANGFDRDYFSALAYSLALTNRLGLTAEISGSSRVNSATPATLTILQALTCSFSPRLVVDGGYYVAAHGDLPTVTFFAGVTFAVGDLYHRLHRAHQ